MDLFKVNWNSHRIRNLIIESPTGIFPDIVYFQSELFGSSDCSVDLPVTIESLAGMRDKWPFLLTIEMSLKRKLRVQPISQKLLRRS